MDWNLSVEGIIPVRQGFSCAEFFLSDLTLVAFRTRHEPAFFHYNIKANGGVGIKDWAAWYFERPKKWQHFTGTELFKIKITTWFSWIWHILPQEKSERALHCNIKKKKIFFIFPLLQRSCVHVRLRASQRAQPPPSFLAQRPPFQLCRPQQGARCSFSPMREPHGQSRHCTSPTASGNASQRS